MKFQPARRGARFGIPGAPTGWSWRKSRLVAADAIEAVFGPDPGLLRLRTAARTVISAAITLAILLLLLGDRGTSAAAPVALGFMVSNFANMTVRDTGPPQQAATLALLAVPALACVVLATVLAPIPWAADLVFIVVVTGAALARMAGPRGNAIGMVAFISYFIGDVTRPPLADLPQLAFAVVLATAAAAAARFVLLPDRPGAALHRAKRHIDRRIGRILAEVDEILATEAGDETPSEEQSRRHRMHRELGRLNDAFLIAQDQIQSLEDWDMAQATWSAFFAVELTAERLIRMAARERRSPDVDAVRARLAQLQQRLLVGLVPPPPGFSRAPAQLAATLDELQEALARLARLWAQFRQLTGRRSPPPASAAAGPPSEPVWHNRFVRQAAQAGTGVALAIAVGTLVSGQRWYWAVIAAFIVGSGVGSRGEALIKALQRLAGTLGGIVAGILLASAVSNHTDVALGLVLVCVFFAFYAFQAAYGVMMFCITVMLALLYGLVGQFQPGLLVLRLEETATGAAIGVLVTAMFLPIRESETLRAAARELLLALADTVQQASRENAEAVARAGSALRSKVQALRNSVAAVKRGWIPLLPLRYRRVVRSGMRCAYLAREIAYRNELDHAQAITIGQKIEATLRRLDRREPAPQGKEGGEDDPLSSPPSENELLDAMLAALDRFDLRLQQALDGRPAR